MNAFHPAGTEAGPSSQQASTSSSSGSTIIPPTEHLQQALHTLSQASHDFANPDPAIRARGEQVFLQVRQADNAIEYATFFIEHSTDAFVVFQSFNMILQSLPSLSHTSTLYQHIPTLDILRDFLAHISITRSQAVDQQLLLATGSIGPLPRGTQASLEQQRWPAYVRARALQTVVAVAKKALGAALEQAQISGPPTADLRAVAAEHMHAMRNILLSVFAAAASPSDAEEIARNHVGLGLLRATIEEFALTPVRADDVGTSASSDRASIQAKGKAKVVEQGSPVGLTATQHVLCKAAFQEHLYAESLSIVLNKLKDAALSAEGRLSPLFNPALSVLEGLLGWSFLHHDIFALVAQQQQEASADTSIVSIDESLLVGSQINFDGTADGPGGTALTRESIVPDALAHVLLSTDLLELLAVAYRSSAAADATEPNSTHTLALHRTRQCLLLALSLKSTSAEDAGHILSPTEAARIATQLGLLSTFIHEHQARGSLVAHGNGLSFLAQACRTFISLTPASAILRSSATGSTPGTTQGMLDFLSALAQLSHAVFALAFSRSRQTQEEDDLSALAEETTDALLACWSSLVSSVRGELASCQDQHVAPLLHSVWSAVQQGLQASLVVPYIKGRMESAAIVTEEDMSEQGEEATKDSELYSDQLISIGLLARVSAAESLHALYELLHPRIAQALGNVPADDAEAAALWEQLHWLFLIAGHVLADGNSGETPTPPIEIASISNGTSGSSPAAPQTLDKLLLEIGVEAFAGIARTPAEASSPQVMETWVWFTSRWAVTYLFSSTGPFAAASSDGSGVDPASQERGTHALSSIVNSLARIIQTWTSEADVILQVAASIQALQLSETIPAFLMERRELGTLLSAVIQAMPTLPSGSHGKLLGAVVGLIFAAPASSSASSSSDPNLAEEYFVQVTQHIRARFETLAGSADFARNQQSAEAIFELIKVLDMLEGLAAAAQPRSARAILAFEGSFLPSLNELARSYRGRAEVVLPVLRIYSSLAEALDLDFTSDADAHRSFYHGLWSFLEILRDDDESLGVVGSSAALENEEPFEGLSRALSIIPIIATYVSASASSMDSVFGTWAAGGTDNASPTLTPDSTIDVVLFAFVNLAPKVRDDFLRTPSLASNFSAACADVSRSCSARLLQLSAASPAAAELLITVASALSKGCQADATDVATNALTGVKALASSARQQQQQVGTSNVAQGPLQTLLGDILTVLLLRPLSSSLVDDYALTTHALLSALFQPGLGGRGHVASYLEGTFLPQVRSSAGHGSGAAAGGFGRSGQEDEQRLQVVSSALEALISASQSAQERLVSLCTNGTHGPQANGGHRFSGVRAQARIEAQAERRVTEEFLRATRAPVGRARAKIRVR